MGVRAHYPVLDLRVGFRQPLSYIFILFSDPLAWIWILMIFVKFSFFQYGIWHWPWDLTLGFIDLDLGIPGKCPPLFPGIWTWPWDHAHDSHLKRYLLLYRYSNNIISNRNELVRRLLSGITLSKLQNIVNVREEANRPIPTKCPTTDSKLWK